MLLLSIPSKTIHCSSLNDRLDLFNQSSSIDFTSVGFSSLIDNRFSLFFIFVLIRSRMPQGKIVNHPLQIIIGIN